jgi:hypothetical protein
MRNRKSMISLLIMAVLGLAFCTAGFADDDIEFIDGEDSGFYYMIKKGDTLWDLSQKFYDSQWDWPGLWEMNDQIKNPHWIYPGNKIRIFLKDKSKKNPIVVIPKKAKSAPVQLKTSFAYTEMDHVGFIRKEQAPALGSIIREQDGALLMTKGDTIYIKPSGQGTLIPGKSYHVFSTETLKQKAEKEEFTGIKHLIKAQIKILEHHTTYAKALITHAYHDVNMNDLIMTYFDREDTLTVEENPEPIKARMICAETNETMINDYRIAFIDIGKEDVVPGQIYSILKENAVKDYSLLVSGKKKDAIDLEDIEAGKLIVLHTEDIASTVMILSSKYAIHPNDMVN